MPAPARKRSATLARPASESKPILAVVLALIGLFLAVAMITHTSSDTSWLPLPDTTIKATQNYCGALGATIAVIFFSLFGYAGFLIPFFILAAAWFALHQRAHTLWPVKVTLMVLSIVLFTPILTQWLGLVTDATAAFDPQGAGGRLGNMLYKSVFQQNLEYGTWLLVFPYGFCLLGVFADDPKATLAAWIAELRDMFGAWNAARKAAAVAAAAEQRRKATIASELRRKQQEVVGATMVVPVAVKLAAKAKGPEVEIIDIPHKGPEEAVGPDTVNPESVTITPTADQKSEPKPEVKTEPKPEPKPERKPPEPLGTSVGKVQVVKLEKIERATASQVLKRRGDYVFPMVSMLNAPAAAGTLVPEDFRKRASDLIETLKQFKVDCVPVDATNGIDVGIQQGPSITRYEIKPAPGVRVEKIANLSNNIAMNLEAEAVRILAPVPGKGTVGIEIPNKNRKDVLLREIIESKAWAEAAMELPVVLGVDSVTNKPVIQDLAKMPHALIAGATGQGKSVCINAIIVSLLYRCTPQDLRFIMVDPKVVELQIYNNLPHLLIPVETDAQRVPAALKWLIAEMSQRYKIFAKVGVKNITGFNAKLAKEVGAPKQEELALSPEEQAAATAAAEEVLDDGVQVPTEKLPYIVCIIDEMADLMMVAAKDIETSVARIAQLARAAGIHLVLATQRPSTDVITGLIKANLPTRIGFKVASQIDSRTILDRGGAETLVGRGDMLFVPPGSATLNRVQGAFVGEHEVAAIVEYLAEKNGKPEFAQDVIKAIKDGAESDDEGGMDGEDGEDPLVAQSWAIIKETRRASVSFLQRRLKLGYNRAARIMDILHEKGYVGPENGSSPREVLVD